MTAVLGQRTFHALPEQVAQARRWLRTLLGDECGDALECLSEVFTNAIVHTASGANQGPVSIVVMDVGPRVYVEVTDAGGITRPHVRRVDDATQYGRGLLVVNALTGGRWGWDEEGPGLTVWFEVPRC